MSETQQPRSDIDPAAITDHTDNDTPVFADPEIALTVNVLRPSADSDLTYRVVSPTTLTRGQVRESNGRLADMGLDPLYKEEVSFDHEKAIAAELRARKPPFVTRLLELGRAAVLISRHHL